MFDYARSCSVALLCVACCVPSVTSLLIAHLIRVTRWFCVTVWYFLPPHAGCRYRRMEANKCASFIIRIHVIFGSDSCITTYRLSVGTLKRVWFLYMLLHIFWFIQMQHRNMETRLFIDLEVWFFICCARLKTVQKYVKMCFLPNILDTGV